MAAATWGEVVVLPENASALRAVRRVAAALTRPGQKLTPSPVLLHGPTGTGKSLLVQTLAKKLSAHPTGPTVQVISAREVRADSPDPSAEPGTFTDFLTADLLAVEDLHHLPPKGTDTICRLLDERAARRRVTLLTAATGPAGLTQFRWRLTTRLAAGLVVRIDPPDSASRRTFLVHRLARRKLTVAPSGIDWLAATADGFRPLVGMVERLWVFSRGFAGELDAAAVEHLLREADTATVSPVERIVARVATAFGVTPKALLGPGRTRTVTQARQVAMFVARESTNLSLPKIGVAFGRDHKTVLHSCRKVLAETAEDAKLGETVRELLRDVG
ncbi:MAG: helix-turn-helix domain-containing protein [Fimbriiglobus sp.]